MIMGRWVVSSGVLAVDCEGEIVFPSARDIFALVHGEIGSLEIRGCLLESPQSIFPELRFSTLGCSLVSTIFTRESEIFFDAIYQRRSNSTSAIICKGKLVDHCIINNCWYYLSTDVTSLETALREANVESLGKISPSQYLKLKRFELLNSEQIFKDEVVEISAESIKKGVPVNQMLPLRATLYPYQETGFYWMKKTLECVGGCILGDEMGLGKTMQIISLMLYYQDKGMGKTLVVAPISLLANWERECKKFAPTLSVLIHHGTERTGFYKDFDGYDVVVTSYSSAANDLSVLNMVSWNFLVLDEAQNIKNPESGRRNVCCNIKRRYAIAVSGTPFENHITDVWSLLDFVMPNILGPISVFKNMVPDNVDGGKMVEPILSSLMLRRLVKDVANELPERVNIDRPIQMSQSECDSYMELLQVARCENTGRVNIGALQSLRMFCTHPFLLDENEHAVLDIVRESAKFQHFEEILDNIISRKEKVIVFTSYKKMFDLFSLYLSKIKGIRNWSINGETEVELRQQIVDKFNAHESSAVLLLNPRAAGTGLNITGANHVIHYNLEWNPSLEDQASARSYRRGQTKTVFVYRFYYKDSVEQIVQERILRKRDIAENAVVGSVGDVSDQADILAALDMEPKL